MSNVTIHLFNGLEVSGREGRTAHLPTEYCRRLLAYLALHPDRRLDRTQVAKCIWADQDIVPRNRLSVSLFLTRQAIEELEPGGSDFVDCSRGWMQLNSKKVRFDVDEFRDLINQARNAADDDEREDAYRRAVRLYTGPLLPNYDDTWAVLMRTEAASSILEASGWLANRAMARGDTQGAKAILMDAISRDGDSLATVKSLLEWYKTNCSEEIALRAAEDIVDGLAKSGRYEREALADLMANWRKNFTPTNSGSRIYCPMYLRGAGLKQAIRAASSQAVAANGKMVLFDSPVQAINTGLALVEQYPSLAIGIDVQITSAVEPPAKYCLEQLEMMDEGTVNISETTRLVMNGHNKYLLEQLKDVPGCWRVLPPQRGSLH